MLLSHANMLFKRAWMMFKFTVRQAYADILSCKYAKHAKNVEGIKKTTTKNTLKTLKTCGVCKQNMQIMPDM